MRRVLGCVLVAWFASQSGSAFAHGRDPKQIELTLDGNTVEIALSPSSEALLFADDDASGALDAQEVSTHREAIRRRLTEGVRLQAGGSSPRIESTSVSFAPHQHEGTSLGSNVAFNLRAAFDSEPAQVLVAIELPFDGPRTLHTARVSPSGKPGVWTLLERTARPLRSGETVSAFGGSDEPSSPRPATPPSEPRTAWGWFAVAAMAVALMVLLVLSMVRHWRRVSELLEVRL